MQSIVSRYGTGTSPFLLPLIKAPGTDERRQYLSAAGSRNIHLPVISEGMGHGSDRTTRIYLASLDNTVIDEANRTIIGSL